MNNDNKTTGVGGVGSEGSFHLAKEDKVLSVSHLRDRMEYNLRHAEEHLVKAKEAGERLHSVGIGFDFPRAISDLVDSLENTQSDHTKAELKLKNYIRRNLK